MPAGPDPRGPTGAAAWLVNIGLFVVLLLLVDTLIGLARGGALGAEEALFVAYGIHVTASLYDGRFGPWRTASWLALTGGFLVLVVTGFHDFLSPHWSPAISAIKRMRDALGAGALVADLRTMAGAAGLLLLLDVALAHAPRLARWPRRRSGAFLLAIVAIELVAVLAAPHLLPPDASQVMASTANDGPPPREVPFSALLLAVDWPMSVGLAVVFTVAALPMSAPLQRAWRFHAATTTLAIWTALCAGLAASWIALFVIGFLYLRPQAWVVAIAAYQPAFFIAAPLLLGRLVRRAPEAPAIVFD